MIVTKKVEVYQTKLMCDECKVEMNWIGAYHDTIDRKLNSHKCPECGKYEAEDKKYPFIEYVEKK